MADLCVRWCNDNVYVSFSLLLRFRLDIVLEGFFFAMGIWTNEL